VQNVQSDHQAERGSASKPTRQQAAVANLNTVTTSLDSIQKVDGVLDSERGEIDQKRRRFASCDADARGRSRATS
jgi:hypothetical protein